MKKLTSFIMCMVMVAALAFGARTTLTVVDIAITSNGLNLTDGTTAAIADGHKFANSGDVFFAIVNGSAGAVVVTFQTPATVAGGVTITEQTVTVAAGKTHLVGNFNKSVFNQSDGMVYVDTDTQTDISYAAVKFVENR